MNHWDGMEEFCRFETLAGGPDPHMAVVGHLSREVPIAERWWRAGCYLAVYNVPTAEYLWTEWPLARIRADSYGDMEAWLGSWIDENWNALQFRRERRPVRSRAKLTRHLLSYAEWIRDLDLRPWYSGEMLHPEIAYEYAWKDILRVYGMGRYVALKWCEFMRRYCEAPIELPDLRPRGGWSPRAALALLYPEYEPILNGSDHPEALKIANQLAERCRFSLESKGITLDRYNLQVLLCDYKQSAIGRRQYPGRSQDSEMEYAQKLYEACGFEAKMWEARLDLFPHWALGDQNGWQEVREPLGNVLADFNYTWTDRLFDWHASKHDLAHPRLHEAVNAR